MTQALHPLHFPLRGSALIEASAGTGKTWTIAALYLRLVLGHGEEASGFTRALLPSEILVMTFTRAATRELSDRIRARLVEAARWFRGEITSDDPFLVELLAAYPADDERSKASHRLMLAAETMDEAAIFTIDAWCQRMLREHAFDSASLFDETLLSDESSLYAEAVRDYWRQQVYPLNERGLSLVLAQWSGVNALETSLRELVKQAARLPPHSAQSLAALLYKTDQDIQAELSKLKEGWLERADRMQAWINACIGKSPKFFKGTHLKPERTAMWLEAIRHWAADPAAIWPDWNATPWNRLTPAGMQEAFSKGHMAAVPADFEATEVLKKGLDELPQPAPLLTLHAASHIAQRMAKLKAQSHQSGFNDMLLRLKAALEGRQGEALRAQILAQYPVALIDEFQDTAPAQYRIFDLLYRIASNDERLGLLLIGDPKQSIYGFRGADIHSYLAAKRATAGRHFRLTRNYRSSVELVAAVNQVFQFAEGESHPAGAFAFRRGSDDPLPFVPVEARGLDSRWEASTALTIWCCDAPDMNRESYLALFAGQCAEKIVTLLNDPSAGFRDSEKLTRLVAADIAVLVRDRYEAAAVRRALQLRDVASVYLSDQDSVFDSDEARDVLRWLQAFAQPQDATLARAALATRTADLTLAELAQLSADDEAWETRVEQLKSMHHLWQRQGVLAALRRFIHDLGLPARLLAQQGGERRLTNILHLAELLQSVSQQLDGEQALLRWFAAQIAGHGEAGDERTVRLESEAGLVKIITVHKSKGLEYPLVFVPFGVSARVVTSSGRSYLDYADDNGERQLDLALSAEGLIRMEAARRAEDLRLLYVALTRARHAVWLGVTALCVKQGSAKTKLHESAFGYVLAAGQHINTTELRPKLDELSGGLAAIVIEDCNIAANESRLLPRAAPAALRAAIDYQGEFERDWSVGSFSSLTRALASVAPPLHAPLDHPAERDPWHRFPRGALPGNFLHEQLEWMGHEGFAKSASPLFAERLAARCERAGRPQQANDVVTWLQRVASTPLPPIGCALADLRTVMPEMEFWFPTEHLDASALDRACQRLLDPAIVRPALPERTLHGMLKGYADLVFEHEGRYWVLDYKSNSLGNDDAAYHPAALATAMAAHRYEIQGSIYLLALHRLLRARLGQQYKPAQQLGGALFLFLRGINHATRGCHLVTHDDASLQALEDILLGAPA